MIMIVPAQPSWSAFQQMMSAVVTYRTRVSVASSSGKMSFPSGRQGKVQQIVKSLLCSNAMSASSHLKRYCSSLQSQQLQQAGLVCLLMMQMINVSSSFDFWSLAKQQEHLHTELHANQWLVAWQASTHRQPQPTSNRRIAL